MSDCERCRELQARIDDIYPMVAGRVIQLQEAGEGRAAARWNEAARRLLGLEPYSERYDDAIRIIGAVPPRDGGDRDPA